MAKGGVRLAGDGEYGLDVVGESHYQGDLERLAGGRTRDGVEVETQAELIPEDDNPHDKKAVRVAIGGRTVGHLSRDDARAFRESVGRPATCAALIVGGWDRGKGDRGHFGVRLDADLSGLSAGREVEAAGPGCLGGLLRGILKFVVIAAIVILSITAAVVYLAFH